MIPVCYTADEEYAMQVAVSMISMLENNKGIDMVFFILANDYSEDTKRKFRIIENKYGCSIYIINIENKMKMLMNTKIANEPGVIRNGMISFMFARLFIGSTIPKSVDKLIYIDSDTLFVNNIKDLYEIEICEGFLYAAVRDLWPVAYNKVIGFAPDDLYFQSGIMLVNLSKWRTDKCEDIILNHINMLQSFYSLHDQDILNICFRGKIQTLPVTFGMVYLLRAYSAKQILDFSGKDEKHYYKNTEIDEAKKTTYVIHYAGDYFGRPWIYPTACADAKLWYFYYKLSPWDDDFLKEKYKPVYGVKYYIKKLIYPFTKSLWLKRVKKIFHMKIEKMDSI